MLNISQTATELQKGLIKLKLAKKGEKQCRKAEVFKSF